MAAVTPKTFGDALRPLLNDPTNRHALTCANDGAAGLDTAVGALTELIVDAADAVAPLRPCALSSSHSPWVDRGIRMLMDRRDRAYRRFRRNQRHEDLLRYRLLRTEVSNKLDTAKNVYYASRIASSASPAHIRRTLRSIGLTSLTLPSPFNYFTPDDLAQHFLRISSASRPISSPMIVQVCRARLPTRRPAFSLSPVSTQQIERVIRASRSKSQGFDNISSTLLSLASPSILPLLTEIFNASISLSSFPDSWKTASIVPLTKIKNLSSVNDTRLISLLCEPSKLLERLVHAQLVENLHTHNIISPHQHGFRCGHSTNTALLELSEKIRGSIERGEVSVLVSFDFSKAFDTIPHLNLLAKLRSIGYDDAAIRWFASYLGGRRLAMRGPDGVHSTAYRATSGIPQGSVLGPLLFLLYINDLPELLVNSHPVIFADDIQILLSRSPFEYNDLIRRVCRETNAVRRWSEINGLTLNAEKTKVMSLGSLAYTSILGKNPQLPRVILNGVHLEYSSSIKVLGIIITPTLNWDNYIASISSKINFSLYSLRYHRRSLTFTLRKRLVQALILPHLNHAAVLLTSLTADQNLRLQRLQNASIRFIYGDIPLMAHITPYRLALGWLSVSGRRSYLLIKLAVKIISTASPAPLAAGFSFPNEQQLERASRRRRPPRLYHETVHRAALFKSFTVSSSRLINDIPFSFNLMHPQPNFHYQLSNHLLSTEKSEWLERCSLEGLTPNPSSLSLTLTLP
uniref:Reverse transcriptase domain-containing protein n=1 Tax=Trichogramma kaykai TaxID=54128 RepID=A0ABD2W2T0_9HYME